MKNNLNLLVKFLAKTDNSKVISKVFSDLFTEKELIEVNNRIEIIKELNKGKSQREIAKKLSVGVATVTRGAKLFKSIKTPSWWTDFLWR